MTTDHIFNSSENTTGTGQKNYLRKKKIIQYLYNNDTASNPELCRYINSTAPSVSKLLSELIEAKIVNEVGFGASIGGRRPNVYALIPTARYTVGVYIDRKEYMIAVFDLSKKVVGEIIKVRLDMENSLRYINEIHKSVNDHLEKQNIKRDKILGIGFSLPGLINSETGYSYTNLNITKGALADMLAEKFQMDVCIENDARVMALAEQLFGAAKDEKNAMCIIVGGGVGMGMIINGKLYQGDNGFAGEFGHIQLNPNGDLCECGKIGCLETMASGKALILGVLNDLEKGNLSRIKEIIKEKELTVDLIVQAARSGDQYAISKFTEIGEYMGKGIAVLLHLLNPGKIIIGGVYSNAGEYIIDPIMQALNKYAINDIKKQTDVMVSSLGRDAALIGTLPLVMNRVFMDTNSQMVNSL
ncbi:MAG: ROK family protein [Bacteroidales bacterium]|nr:ROK family protein [Bacteroidales bacterium]